MNDNQFQKILERGRLEKSKIPISEVEKVIRQADSRLLARRLALSVLGLSIVIIGAFVYFKNDTNLVETPLQKTTYVSTVAVINEQDAAVVSTSSEEENDINSQIPENEVPGLLSSSEQIEVIQEEAISIDIIPESNVPEKMDGKAVLQTKIETPSKAQQYRFVLKNTFNDSELNKFVEELSEIGVVLDIQKVRYDKSKIIERIKGTIKKRQFEYRNFDKLLFIVNQDGISNRGVNIIKL